MPATTSPVASANLLTVGTRIMLREDMVSAIGEQFRAGSVFEVVVEGSVNVRVTNGICTPWLAVGSIAGARPEVCGMPATGPGMPLML